MTSYQNTVPDPNHPAVVFRPHCPVNGYARGSLRRDSGRFMFTAYRLPYLPLTKRSYGSLAEFMDAYNALVRRREQL